MLYDIITNRTTYNFEEFPILKKVLNELSDEEINELLGLIQNLKKEHLYNGLVHGLYHSEKVLMFTYLICKANGVEEPYRSILFDAALYHDIGRQDDRENTFHGFISAKQIDKVIQDNQLYSNPYYTLLLKAIIDAHSQSDEQKKNCYLNNAYDLDLLDASGEVSEELVLYSDIYLKMATILKDADALDRKRFGDASLESLNSLYLREQSAHDLIGFAEELNGFYYELIKSNYEEIDEANIEEAPCVHSIGFDFFKINSVLIHGVLSQDEMKKRNLSIPRNFAGGNFDRWISVVDIKLLKMAATASKEFVERGITFVCEKVKMHEPSPLRERESAILTGRPWNKSNHEDERYVKNRIAPENIIAINVPTRFVHKSILDTERTGDPEHDLWRMHYIYNSLDIKMIKRRVEYYKQKTETPDDSPYWITIEKMLEAYNNVLVYRDDYGRDNITKELTPILDIINANIGRMMYSYYYSKIGSGGSDITVLDVVNYELSQNYMIHYDFCETVDGATFFIREETKSIEGKQL